MEFDVKIKIMASKNDDRAPTIAVRVKPSLTHLVVTEVVKDVPEAVAHVVGIESGCSFAAEVRMAVKLGPEAAALGAFAWWV